MLPFCGTRVPAAAVRRTLLLYARRRQGDAVKAGTGINRYVHADHTVTATPFTQRYIPHIQLKQDMTAYHMNLRNGYYA